MVEILHCRGHRYCRIPGACYFIERFKIVIVDLQLKYNILELDSNGTFKPCVVAVVAQSAAPELYFPGTGR